MCWSGGAIFSILSFLWSLQFFLSPLSLVCFFSHPLSFLSDYSSLLPSYPVHGTYLIFHPLLRCPTPFPSFLCLSSLTFPLYLCPHSSHSHSPMFLPLFPHFTSLFATLPPHSVHVLFFLPPGLSAYAHKCNLLQTFLLPAITPWWLSLEEQAYSTSFSAFCWVLVFFFISVFMLYHFQVRESKAAGHDACHVAPLGAFGYRKWWFLTMVAC